MSADDTAHGFTMPIDVWRLGCEVYTPEGVRIWWRSRNAVLDGRTPEDVYHDDGGEDRIAAYLNRLADGNF